MTRSAFSLLCALALVADLGAGCAHADTPADPPLGMDKLGYFRTPGPDLIGLLGLTATLK